jgi:hypothetical protein
MVFTLETGDGLADANSYIDVQTFKDISDLLGYDYADLYDPTIEARLVRATTVLDASYRSQFPGERQTTTQALEWPRSDAVYLDGAEISENTIPKEIQIATVELTNVISSGSNIQPTISSSGEMIYNRQRVEGAVEQEQRFDNHYGNSRDIYTAVDDALSRITGGVSGYFDLKIQRVGGDG